MSTVTPGRDRGAPALAVTERERAFVVSFGQAVRVASWAIVHGGLALAEHVVWREVHDDELGPAVDARAFLEAYLGRQQLTGSVGLLTSRRLSSRVDLSVSEAGVTARCIATVGLGNALRAGDPPWHGLGVGTVNVLVYVDEPLTDEALLEANATATEAKCAALFDARVVSRRSGRLATGTGTDCTVAACPLPAYATSAASYAGKYTPVGAAVGAAVERAVAIGIRDWQREAGMVRRGAPPRAASPNSTSGQEG